MKTRKAHTVLVIMLAIHFPQSDSTAVITTEGSLRERSDFECGTSVVIICTTQPKPNDVIWTVDNVWTADCTFGVCTENSSNPAFYTFSHNATEGVFHLNIQPVSFQQNGKIYACTEGSGPTEMSDTLTAEVNVLPDISTAIDATSNTQVVVTTGCVYPVTNITFEWYIYQVGIEAMLYTKQKPVQTFNDSGCSLGDCGHSEAARVSSTLDIPSVETGDLYFFQVIVKHAATNKVVILNSTVKYRINVDQGDITSDRSDYVLLIALCVTAGLIILLVVTVIFIFCTRCRITDFKWTERTNNMIKLQWKVVCCCIPTSTILKCSQFNQVIEEYCTDATGPLMHHSFARLKEKTIYDFDLETKTGMCCTAKATVTVKTLGMPDPPTEFYIDQENITDSSVLLQWKAGYNGGYRQHFMLMYSEEANRDWISKYVDDSKKTSQDYIVSDIKGLKSRTGYYFKVFAANDIGRSPTSEQLKVYTKGKPDPPTELSVISNRVTQSSIAIQWKPGYDGGYEQVFKVMYSINDRDRTSENSGSEESMEWIYVHIDESSGKHHMEYTIKDLAKRTTYKIMIVAENQCGNSLSLLKCETKGKKKERL